jgi:hypothetical protein
MPIKGPGQRRLDGVKADKGSAAGFFGPIYPFAQQLLKTPLGFICESGYVDIVVRGDTDARHKNRYRTGLRFHWWLTGCGYLSLVACGRSTDSDRIARRGKFGLHHFFAHPVQFIAVIKPHFVEHSGITGAGGLRFSWGGCVMAGNVSTSTGGDFSRPNETR